MTRPELGPGLRGALVVTFLALALAGCDLLPRVGLAPTLAPTFAPTPAPTPAPSSTPERVALDEPSPPVRIRIPSLGIDLPVIRSDRRVRGSTPGYPACDVAIWWEVFDRPGQPGTTWIMAHAQEGMFLPLLEAANERSPRSLRGRLVELQLRDGRLLTYRTFRVKPRTSTTDLRLATAGRREREHRLVLQTSTGRGSDPKLLVAARLVRATSTDEPRPRPKPRACG
jgi:hypothetical protein